MESEDCGGGQSTAVFAYPTRGTVLIKLDSLVGTELVGLLALLHAVDDVVLVEAAKVGVASLPAVCAL